MVRKELPSLSSSEALERVALDNAQLTEGWDPVKAQDVGYDITPEGYIPPLLESVETPDPDEDGSPVVLNEYRLADPVLDAEWREQRAARAGSPRRRRVLLSRNTTSLQQNKAYNQYVADVRRRGA